MLRVQCALGCVFIPLGRLSVPLAGVSDYRTLLHSFASMKLLLAVSSLAILSSLVAAIDPEQCGPTAGNQKCKNNQCCSQYGWCGKADAYCLTVRHSWMVRNSLMTISRDVSQTLASAKECRARGRLQPLPAPQVQWKAHQPISVVLKTRTSFALPACAVPSMAIAERPTPVVGKGASKDLDRALVAVRHHPALARTL